MKNHALTPSAPRSVLVFGVSGATWKVVDPLIAAGLLPNLKRLQEEGCRGTLLSIRAAADKHYRPQVAWASMATGCGPERHGITRFFHTANDLKVPSIWEIYQNQGLRVGVYGWPLDWPPRPTNGFVIPSPWARDTGTWPPDLSVIKALDREQQNAERQGKSETLAWSRASAAITLLRFGASLRTFSFLAMTLLRSMRSTNLEERSLLLRNAKLELSADIFSHLCVRFDPHFRSFHTFLVDFASHRYWRYFEPSAFPARDHEIKHGLRHAIADAYARTDRVLGRLVAGLPANAIVAVLSEHGMRAEPVSAEVGEWRYVINGTRLSRVIGLEDKIVSWPVARWIAFRARNGQSLPGDTADRLRRIVVAETGLPLFQIHEHGSDEVVVKFSIDRNVPSYRDGDLESLRIRYGDCIVPFTEFTRRLGRVRSAMHDREAILLLRGPGIRQGVRLPDAQVVDVAPTLLRAAGLPVPSGLDGHLLDVFAEAQPTLLAAG